LGRRIRGHYQEAHLQHRYDYLANNYYSVKFGESGDWKEEEIVIDDKKGKAPIPQHVKHSKNTGKYHGGNFKEEEYDNGPENKNKGK
jgi:hypothetical protein